MPEFGSTLHDLCSHIRRETRNLRRELHGMYPLAPAGALSLCEENARGGLTIPPPTNNMKKEEG